MIDQFDRLRRRNAFVEQYKKEKIFQDGLEEFDDARYAHALPVLCALADLFPHLSLRATAEELLKEYKACESPDYITYVRVFVPFHPLQSSCAATLRRSKLVPGS